MATEKQIDANRRNAQRSTGPRTEEGKAASARNATTHGLTAATLVIQDDEQDEFLDLREGLADSLCPEGTLQEALFEEILKARWKLRRAQLAEAKLYRDNPEIDPLLDDQIEPKLTRIQIYAKREESSMYRAMRKLGEIQTE